MTNISQNVNIEMLEKLPDGTYKRKYPKTRADDGTTFDEHLAESTQQAHLAKNIGLEDTEGKFTATDVEGAMNELFTNVSNGKDLVSRAITGVDDSVVIPTDPSFNDLANAIKNISTSPIAEPGDVLLAESLSETETTERGYYVKTKDIKVNVGGTVRVSFAVRNVGSSNAGRAKIYVNDQPVGISRINNGLSYVTYVEDVAIEAGDHIQIYALNGHSTTKYSTKVKDLIISTKVDMRAAEVIMG